MSSPAPRRVIGPVIASSKDGFYKREPPTLRLAPRLCIWSIGWVSGVGLAAVGFLGKAQSRLRGHRNAFRTWSRSGANCRTPLQFRGARLPGLVMTQARELPGNKPD